MNFRSESRRLALIPASEMRIEQPSPCKLAVLRVTWPLMADAIVRWSISLEGDNRTGNEIRGTLESHGFTRSGTGCFRADNIPLSEATQAIAEVMLIASNPPGGGILDHIWTYIDDPD